MFASLVIAAAISLIDPSGDALGSGDLLPPTGEVTSMERAFDLQELMVLTEEPLTLEVTMGSLSNPFALENGLSLPIIEIYLDFEPGGSQELLPGSGMRLPAGSGWDYALRVTGDEGEAFSNDSYQKLGLSAGLPLRAERQGNTLVIVTPLMKPRRPRVFVVVGVYDPFSPSRWRPLSPSPSPWAFSGSDQRYPVIDLLAPDQAAQQAALETGTLPIVHVGSTDWRWFALMALGLTLTLIGVGLRSLPKLLSLASRRHKTSVASAAPDQEQTPATPPDTVLKTGDKDGKQASLGAAGKKAPGEADSLPPEGVASGIQDDHQSSG